MSLTTAVRAVFRSASKKFPGAAEADIAVYAGLVFEAASTNLKSTYKDSEAVAYADSKLAEAASAYEEWAVNLRDSVLVNVIKPIVDKAAEKGVDPVPALVLQADVTEEQAHVIALPQADRALALLAELGILNDQALDAQQRYLDLKDRTKTAKETYDRLAELVLTRLQQATHASDLPLFDREADQIRMEAGPEAITEATDGPAGDDLRPGQGQVAPAEEIPF